MFFLTLVATGLWILSRLGPSTDDLTTDNLDGLRSRLKAPSCVFALKSFTRNWKIDGQFTRIVRWSFISN